MYLFLEFKQNFVKLDFLVNEDVWNSIRVNSDSARVSDITLGLQISLVWLMDHIIRSFGSPLV